MGGGEAGHFVLVVVVVIVVGGQLVAVPADFVDAAEGGQFACGGVGGHGSCGGGLGDGGCGCVCGGGFGAGEGFVAFGNGFADSHPDVEEGGLHFCREGGAEQSGGRDGACGKGRVVSRGEEVVVNGGWRGEAAAFGCGGG